MTSTHTLWRYTMKARASHLIDVVAPAVLLAVFLALPIFTVAVIKG